MKADDNKLSRHMREKLKISVADQVIYKTHDPLMFKKIIGNRPISEGNFRNLRAKVNQMNLLHLFPVVVNKDLAVIDGQHRLRVAAELGLPIYFTIEADADIETTREVNTVGCNWTTVDFLNNFIEQGVKTYINFNAWYLINKDLLSMPQALSIYSYKATHCNARFKGGDIIKGDEKKVAKVIEFLRSVEEIRPDAAKTTIFQRFVIMIIKKDRISTARLITKFRQDPMCLRYFPSTEGKVMSYFEEIYNGGLSKYISFRMAGA